MRGEKTSKVPTRVALLFIFYSVAELLYQHWEAAPPQLLTVKDLFLKNTGGGGGCRKGG